MKGGRKNSKSGCEQKKSNVKGETIWQKEKKA